MKFLKTKLPNEVVLKDHYVGDISITDGLVDVTDPCYEKDVWCALFGKKVKAGDYSCYITLVNFPHMVKLEDDSDARIYHGKVGDVVKVDDTRITELEIVHKDFLNNDKQAVRMPCVIGVDAGLCGFYNHKPSFEQDDAWSNFWQNLKKLDGTHCVCDIKPYGVTVSSGFGDGAYPLYIKRNKGEIIALKVRFC